MDCAKRSFGSKEQQWLYEAIRKWQKKLKTRFTWLPASLASCAPTRYWSLTAVAVADFLGGFW